MSDDLGAPSITIVPAPTKRRRTAPLTPKQKKAQAKFSRAAKACRGKGKGEFRSCIAEKLRKAKK